MGNDFDPAKPSKYIAYLDANGLYAWAMTQPLPMGECLWMSDEELLKWDQKEEGVGCVLEVDVEVPKELHDHFNDFPLLPERIEVNGVEKLIPNLRDKEKLIVHEKTLKQALKLKKVWRGISFNEDAWLKSFIMKNANLRMKSKNAFEKDFFKLMNNAVFGKTMENIRNRVNIHLVCDQKKLLNLTAKQNFHHTTIFDEDLVAVHMRKTKVFFNKPVFVGMSILEISKALMADFHYEFAKKKWKKCQLCFTDTDSLMYEIETDHFFEDIAGDVDARFDTSDFPPDHPSGIAGKNKKVLGMMKDEACGKIILEFVGLRAKLYSFIFHGGGGTKKAKGVKKRVVKQTITHQDFFRTLRTGKPQMRTMKCIKS